MPDIVVHTGFGAEALQQSDIEIDRRVFDFGLLGPDPYLFYRFYVPPFRNRVNRYASVMHREHTGDFLAELACRAKQNSAVFSYLAGFLCHYALDANTHPYINQKANNSSVMHMAIEHKLDILYGGDIRIPPFLPATLKEDVGGAIKAVYGWDDAWEALRQGRRDMAPFYRIVSDQNGRLDAFARKTHSRLALVSYRSRALDKMDLSGFTPLYRRALDDAAAYIKAAQDFVGGTIGEEAFRAVIGSRSYIEG